MKGRVGALEKAFPGRARQIKCVIVWSISESGRHEASDGGDTITVHRPDGPLPEDPGDLIPADHPDRDRLAALARSAPRILNLFNGDRRHGRHRPKPETTTR